MGRTIAVLLVVLTLLGGCGDTATSERYRPAPGLGPQDVVRRQVEALGQNDGLGDDRGIRLAWRFASPANREGVGPLARFRRLLRNPHYRPLLDTRSAAYQAPVFRDERAAIAVTVTTAAGRQVDYVFFLSRHDRADCQGCWLIDAVQPDPEQQPAAGPRVNI